MSGKEKTIVAIILVVIVLLAIFLPSGDEELTEEQEEVMHRNYHRWKTMVAIAGGVLFASIAGYLTYLQIDIWRLGKTEKQRKNKEK